MLAPSFVFSIVSCIALGASSVHGDNYNHAARDTFSSTNGLKTRPVQSAASASSGSETGLINNGDVWYLTEITLGGSQFIVQLDSGSTDLVLFPDRHIETQSVIKDSQINATYGTGWTAGPIAVAKLEFGGYTIESQAFLNGTSVSDWDKQYSLPLGIRGIMGVALDTSYSWIHDEIDSLYDSQQAQELGRNALANIFHQDASLGNFTIVLLGRTDDGEGTGEGYLGIGEYPEGFEDFFTNIKPVETYTSTDWNVPVDAVTVNEKKVSLKSAVKGAPAGKAIATLDTGTGAASVSKDVLDAMYGGIQGAWWSDDFGAWVVPCLKDAPNITFTIGGQAYYIHPLDLTDVQDLRPDYNYTICTSTFDILDFDNDEFDFLLGDSFLRNAYASFYYGDFDAKGDVVKSPSVKLLSPSNGVDVTYADFLSRRHQNLASLPPEATKAQLQNAFSQAQSDSKATSTDVAVSENAASSDGVDGSYQALIDKLDTFAPVVIGMLGAIFAVLLGLLGLGITMCIRRGRTVGSGRTVDPSYAPVPLRFKEPEGQYKDEENVRYHQ